MFVCVCVCTCMRLHPSHQYFVIPCIYGGVHPTYHYAPSILLSACIVLATVILQITLQILWPTTGALAWFFHLICNFLNLLLKYRWKISLNNVQLIIKHRIFKFASHAVNHAIVIVIVRSYFPNLTQNCPSFPWRFDAFLH